MVESKINILTWLPQRLEEPDPDLLQEMAKAVVEVLMSAEAGVLLIFCSWAGGMFFHDPEVILIIDYKLTVSPLSRRYSFTQRMLKVR